MERLLNFLLIRIKVPPSIPPETVLIPKSEIVIAELTIVKLESLERLTTTNGMRIAKLPLRIGITSKASFMFPILNRWLIESFKFEVISENEALKSNCDILLVEIVSS